MFKFILEKYFWGLANLFTSKTVLADSGLGMSEVSDKVVGVLEEFTAAAKNVANPICILVIVFCGIRMLFASDQQSIRQAKSALLTAAVAMLLINLAGPIASWFGKLGA